MDTFICKSINFTAVQDPNSHLLREVGKGREGENTFRIPMSRAGLCFPKHVNVWGTESHQNISK